MKSNTPIDFFKQYQLFNCYIVNINFRNQNSTYMNILEKFHSFETF